MIGELRLLWAVFGWPISVWLFICAITAKTPASVLHFWSLYCTCMTVAAVSCFDLMKPIDWTKK